jgi:hypothetical protein
VRILSWACRVPEGSSTAVRGDRNRDNPNPTLADCEPGCQDCYWSLTCDGPPDLCVRCGLSLPYTGFVPESEPVCECDLTRRTASGTPAP